MLGDADAVHRRAPTLANRRPLAEASPLTLLPPAVPHSISQPKYLLRWIDLAKVLNKHSKHRGNLRESVEAAGLTWQGRAHSAIDDARNTAR